jgi:DNA repair exonuclease SbcCD nuclease subunit
LLVSHISDIHLGYAQFNLQEREEDLYEVFDEAIDKSISEHVKAVIFAGDIFHNPKPNGAAIVRLARQLKKLKDKSIPVLFILGEHDISRSNDVPLPYLFHNLGLARRLKPDTPVLIDNTLFYGFNKERRSNIEGGLLRPFKKLESILKNDVEKHSLENRSPKKILVLHQGLSDFNKFAGEIQSSDLPTGFDYYAMGHYHDHIEKTFPHLNGGIVAYPGSIDLGHNEAISDVEKGFIIADTSSESNNVNINWVKLDKRRPQLEYHIDYSNLQTQIDTILEKVKSFEKVPVVNLNVHGGDIDQRILTRTLATLENSVLYYNWSIQDEKSLDTAGFSYDSVETFELEKELSVLIKKSLSKDHLVELSLDLINMINESNLGTESSYNGSFNKSRKNEIIDYLWKTYENNKLKYDSKQDDEEKEGDNKTI